MKVVFYDGTTMDCKKVEFGKDVLILDGYRTVPYLYVLRIVNSE